VKAANLKDKNTTRRKLKISADKALITGEIHYAGYKIPLYRFFTSPRTPKREGGKPVPIVARQKIDGNAEPWSGGFIAKMKSGHIGVFEHVYREQRYPIREVMGASVAEMVGNTVVLDEIEHKAYVSVYNKAESLIERILRGETL
jgi:hypothetical protein